MSILKYRLANSRIINSRKLDPRTLLSVALGAAVLLMGGGSWLVWNAMHPPKAAPQMRYTASGYGGFAPVPKIDPKLSAGQRTSRAARSLHPFVSDPAQPLRDAYNAGRYSAVETAALRLIDESRVSRSQAVREQAAQASSLLAYSAARRHDLKLARTRFAAAQKQAANLPDKGREPSLPGEVAPTLEAEAAFQHAVCTGALGDKPGAEGEYVAFMKRYPESPLVHAAEHRIEMLHGGNLPPAALAAWQQATATAAAQEKAQRVAQSLCGPECLAELLRRRGQSVSVPTLAREMGTSDQGTSLEALARAARRHGFAPQGLALTVRGLGRQKLPAIALVVPGHYVLVEDVASSGVTVWDPDARGVGHGAVCTLGLTDWQRQWQGLTLALAPAQVAQR